MMEPSRSPDSDAIRSKVAEVCKALGACAAGYWQLDQTTAQLFQVAFVPGVGLNADVGREFENATQVVPLSQQSLGIVIAALSGRPAVSRVCELPADSGSGAWLRAFGASRSVAVPIFGAQRAVRAVISIALPEQVEIGDEAVAYQLSRVLA
jgi:hypothetical protein